MNNNPPSLRSMLTALEQRLDRLSDAELRQTLLTHAANLPAQERSNFLDIFTFPVRDSASQPASVQLPQAARDTTWPIDTDPLLTEIDDFTERVGSGYFYQGFGWDDEIYDERSYGDESWVDEMDDYFSAASQAFIAGSLGLARAAYEKLFGTLNLDNDVGTFCGPAPAVAMLEVNLHECMSQFLRAVYETSTEPERTGELSRQWLRLPLPGAEPSLQDIRDCSLEDMAGFEAFLPLWVKELANGDRGDMVTRTLLVEAAIMSSGAAGLRDLARQSGPGQGSLYLEWIRALRTAAELSPAADAAREALQAPGISSRNRATIAEELAELSVPDLGAVLEARRLAWRNGPDEARLLLLHLAATQLGDPTRVMIEELEYAESGQSPEPIGASIFSALLVLATKADRAAQQLSLPPTQQGHAVSGAILIPYLLVSASKAFEGSLKAREWAMGYLQRVDWISSAFRLYGTPNLTEVPKLSELFEQMIHTENPDTSALESRLEAALGQLDRDVAAIVENKRRGEYQKAAEWLAHGALAISLARGDDAGADWFQVWLIRYPRHIAFRREMENVRSETTLTA